MRCAACIAANRTTEVRAAYSTTCVPTGGHRPEQLGRILSLPMVRLNNCLRQIFGASLSGQDAIDEYDPRSRHSPELGFSAQSDFHRQSSDIATSCHYWQISTEGFDRRVTPHPARCIKKHGDSVHCSQHDGLGEPTRT